nr:ribosomal protein L4 [Calliblepharis sp.]
MIEQTIQYNLHNISKNKTEKSKTIKLNINPDTNMYLIHRTLLQQLHNKRQGTANTKTRSEVRGGGKKPWKQKGTGRARAGSTRSPLWKGGGIIFGPKYKNYYIKINKKEKHLAISNTLYNKAKNTLIIEKFANNINSPSTKLLLKEIKDLGFNTNNNILIIVTKKERNLYLSTRNLKNVELISVHQLNIFSLLKAKKLIITCSALDQINEVYNEK